MIVMTVIDDCSFSCDGLGSVTNLESEYILTFTEIFERYIGPSQGIWHLKSFVIQREWLRECVWCFEMAELRASSFCSYRSKSTAADIVACPLYARHHSFYRKAVVQTAWYVTFGSISESKEASTSETSWSSVIDVLTFHYFVNIVNTGSEQLWCCVKCVWTRHQDTSMVRLHTHTQHVKNRPIESFSFLFNSCFHFFLSFFLPYFSCSSPLHFFFLPPS